MSGKKFVVALMLVTAVLITVTGIYYGQSFIRMLPLYLSLVAMYMQSEVNRFAPLLAGICSFLYAIVYIYYGLYALAIYAVVLCGPLQIVTFFRWKKRAYGQSVMLRRMSWKARILNLATFCAAWFVLYIIMRALGSSYTVFDNLSSLLGGWTTFLTIFAFVEYIWVTILSVLCNIVLYSSMLADAPEQITYLIYTVYTLICSCLAVKKAKKLWKEQNSCQEEKKS